MSKDNGVFFGKLAQEYAQKGPHLKIWKELERPWLKETLKRIVYPPLNPATTKVLELGCGGGKTIEILQEIISPRNIVGLEPSQELAYEAKTRFPNVNIVRALSQELRFPPETFDLVTLINVIHLLSDKELCQTMGNIWHCLKNNGILVTLTPLFYFERGGYEKYQTIQFEKRRVPWTEDALVPMYPRTLSKLFRSITRPESKQPFLMVGWNELLGKDDQNFDKHQRLGIVAVKMSPESRLVNNYARFRLV